MSSTKISIISDDKRTTQKVVNVINFLELELGEVVEKYREVFMKLHPTEQRIIVLIEPQDSLMQDQLVNYISQIKKIQVTAPIIFLGQTKDITLIRELFRAGIDDYLSIPEELEDLEKVLETSIQTLKRNINKLEMEKSKSQTGAGTVFSFYSAKGGVGTTFISSNFANVLAMHAKDKKVLLIDLNLQFGGVQSLFHLDHNRDIADLKPVLQELSESQIHNVTFTMEDSGLDILFSPSSPEEFEQFQSEDIDLLINACKLYYDVIILDLPKELNEISVSGLNNSNFIYYVTQLERPTIEVMLSVCDVLERYQLIKNDNVRLVVNQFSKKNDITLEDLQKMCKFQVVGTVAEQYKVLQNYLNIGSPIHQSSQKIKRGLGQDIFKMAEETLLFMKGE